MVEVVTAVVAAVPVQVNGDLSDAPQPRLCHVKKWADFTGYGFNLYAEKGTSGHFVGNVEDNSPADLAGLKDGDKIIEVNGIDMLDCTHAVAVNHVKENPSGVKMFVVDKGTEDYYSRKGIGITSDLPNIRRLENPDRNPQNGKCIP